MGKKFKSKDGLSLGIVVLLSAAVAQANSSCPVASSQMQYDAVSTKPSLATDTLSLTKTLRGHIPHVIKNMSDAGKLSEDQLLSVTVTLQLNNEAELDQRIAELYQVGSPYYHQFLTSAEFKARYSPTDEQVANETAFLESQGITVQSVSDNNVLLRAQGTVGVLNQTFKTEIHAYNAQSGKSYFAPAYDLQTPIGSQISGVVGLNNVTHLHSHLVRQSKKSPTKGHDGSGPNGGLAPSDITTAYGVPASANGTGQTLALFELDGYTPSDIAGFEQNYGLPSVTLQNVLIDSFNGTPGDGADEVTLDIELMVSLAPKASKILVYEGPNSDQGLLDTYAKIASDNLATQISTSWGQAEDQSTAATMQSENTIFKQMVAQGQALFAAAGDSGSDDDGSNLGVDDPSSQPYVTGAGGTTLTMGQGSTYVSETTWNELASQEGAGGGGISTVWTIPSWQTSAATADTQFSKTMRNTPDVSLNADPVTGYAIYIDGQWETIGGTSAAAPLWAAFTALVNQQRLAAKLSPIGFINPAIYAIGVAQSYATSFNDIADDSTNGSGDGYKAVKGYDNATGWGTFKGAGLLQALSHN